MYKVRATFRLRGPSKYSFERAVELGRLRLETRDDRICGEIEVEVEEPSFDLARKKVLEELDKVSSLLTLVFKEGLAVGDVELGPITAVRKGEGTTEIEIHVAPITSHSEVSIMVVRRYSKEKLDEIERQLRELMDRVEKMEKGADLLRAIRWWRKGYLEEDKVDRFIDYYIAFEMLASLKGYKDRYQDWARRFSEDYSITYRPDGRTSISDIRNWLMHAPGLEKEKAEELASLYADRFGAEVLRAIKRITFEITSA